MVAHIPVAENYIKDIETSRNKYGSPSNIIWDGKNSLILAKCASWTSGLLQHTYGWNSTIFKAIFGISSPQSAEYHDMIENQSKFINIQKVTDIKRGDIVAISYYPAGDTGHMVFFFFSSNFFLRCK